MASHSCFIFAFFIAISFSSMDIGLAARHLMQATAPNFPAIPSFTNPTVLPLPSFPTLPQPQGNVPALPTIPSLPQPSLPTVPTIPQLTLPPLAATSLPNLPSSFPFLSPPPSSSTP